jgi:osmoprotectant transport system permease protein
VLGLVFGFEDPRSKWIFWPYVSDHLGEFSDRFVEHLVLLLLALAFGLLVAIPLALLSARFRRIYGPTLAVTGILYTVPSLGFFAMLIPVTGLSRATAVIPLAAYTLLILVRNTVTGLDAVPDEVKEAARGMGYSRARQVLRVELPLAFPTIITGIRIATVTTIGLITVTALVGQGGLGALIIDGFKRDFRTPLSVGIILSLGLAILADLFWVGVLRVVTPWRRTVERA